MKSTASTRPSHHKTELLKLAAAFFVAAGMFSNSFSSFSIQAEEGEAGQSGSTTRTQETVQTDSNSADMVVNGIEYEPTGSATAAVVNASGASGNITIPASITWKNKTYAVTAVYAKAFLGCSNLESVTLPLGLTKIRNYAFAMCTSLKEINLSDTLISIGKEAFSNCTSLTSIALPEGLETIGESAFEGCSSLEAVQIPDSLTSLGDYAFFNCPNLKTFIFNSSSLHFGDHIFNNPDVQIYGSGSKAPDNLGSYENAWQGAYEGENLNEAYTGEWVYDSSQGKYKWIRPDESQAFSSWIPIHGQWYYVDEDGWRVDGWKEIDGTYYRFAYTGEMQANEWVIDNGHLYFLDENGVMLTSTWKETDGKSCYFLSDGTLARNRIVPWNGAAYYLDSEGWMVKNQTIMGYHFGDDGRCSQLFLTIPEEVEKEAAVHHQERVAAYEKKKAEEEALAAAKAEAAAKGEAFGEWRKRGQNIIWKRPDGYLAYMTWIYKDGHWYYVDEQGYRTTGWKEVDGSYYHFGNTGIMTTNTWVPDKGSYYYVGSDGKMASSRFVPWNGIGYYADSTGALVYNQKVMGIDLDQNGRAFHLQLELPGQDVPSLVAAALTKQEAETAEKTVSSSLQKETTSLIEKVLGSHIRVHADTQANNPAGAQSKSRPDTSSPFVSESASGSDSASSSFSSGSSKDPSSSTSNSGSPGNSGLSSTASTSSDAASSLTNSTTSTHIEDVGTLSESKKSQPKFLDTSGNVHRFRLYPGAAQNTKRHQSLQDPSSKDLKRKDLLA